MNGAGKGLDLDSLYRRQMREPLKRAGIEWEGGTPSAGGLSDKSRTYRCQRVNCRNDSQTRECSGHTETLH